MAGTCSEGAMRLLRQAPDLHQASSVVATSLPSLKMEAKEAVIAR